MKVSEGENESGSNKNRARDRQIDKSMLTDRQRERNTDERPTSRSHI